MENINRMTNASLLQCREAVKQQQFAQSDSGGIRRLWELDIRNIKREQWDWGDAVMWHNVIWQEKQLCLWGGAAPGGCTRKQYVHKK